MRHKEWAAKINFNWGTIKAYHELFTFTIRPARNFSRHNSWNFFESPQFSIFTTLKFSAQFLSVLVYIYISSMTRGRGGIMANKKKCKTFCRESLLCYAQWIAFKVHLALHVVPHKTSERKIVNCCIFVCSHDDKNFGGRMSFCVAVHFIAQKFLFDFFVLFHVAVERPPLPTPRDASHGKNGEMNGTFWAFKLKKIL